MSTNNNGKDYLTTLPTELLIKVISAIPLDTFLSLTHTSARLRKVIKNNASTICNDAVISRFPSEVEFLQSVKENGWLVPTMSHIPKTEWWLFTGGSFELLISKPGPQFLYALEKNLVALYDDGKWCIAWWQLQVCLDTLNKEVVTVDEDGESAEVVQGRRLPEMLWYYGIPGAGLGRQYSMDMLDQSVYEFWRS